MRQASLLLALILLITELHAQTLPYAAYKQYPFPTELTGSAKGNRIAWAVDEQGKRNVYVAEGPDFTPRKLTNYNMDDGQEITSLTLSDDGKWVVFVRGGDHSGNWDEDAPTDPGFALEPFKVQVASIPFAGGTVKYLSEGDEPVIAPAGDKVSFIKGGQIWSASIDGSTAAKKLFTARGTLGNLQYKQDGTALMFVAERGDHSVIGIYTDSTQPLKWIAPSFSRDNSPRWSPDGTRIVFIRRPGAGGAPDSLLVRKHNPWAIYTAEVATGKEALLWKAPTTLRGSSPGTHGGTNLHWAAGNTIVFLSYQDGWPHLYSIDANNPSAPKLLTPGDFMCEHITLSPDKKYLTFSANTGNDKLDIERRHAAVVDLTTGKMQVVTQGEGLEWTPILTGDGATLAFIHATAQQCPVLSVMKFNGTKILTPGATLVPATMPMANLITPKQVIFKAADGTTVHADLFLPNTNSQKKAAIVYVHGGPPRQMLLGWNYSDYYSNAYSSNQYLASLGFVVLAVNYRLGIGYGYEFHQAPHSGMWGADEYKDIKAAGEWLQAQSYIDPKRIGIYGGSYGGYLTAMALSRDSKIFAAGVDIHGVHDWVTASALTNAQAKYEKAPDLDEALKTAWQSSPVSTVAGWTSPVLIIHADDDRNVRFNQSTDLIQRLEKQGVPLETLMIVDDTHHLMRWQNAVTVYSAVADFFLRKLK